MSDGAQTRNLILATAARLFASAGYAAVSMRDVAAETSMTPANLYYHFKDKETLILETLVHVFADRASSLDDIFGMASTPNEKIDVFIDWFVHLLFEDSIFSKLLFRELLDGDERRMEYITKTVFERPFSLIRGAAAELSDGSDPILSAASIVGLVLGHFQMAGTLPHLPGGRPEHADPRVISSHVTALLEHAFGTPKGRA